MGWTRFMMRCLCESCRVHSPATQSINSLRRTIVVSSTLTHASERTFYTCYKPSHSAQVGHGFSTRSPALAQHAARIYGRTRRVFYSSTRSVCKDFYHLYPTHMTVRKCQKITQDLFRQNSISEPTESAVHLIAHVLGHKTLSNVRVDRKMTQDEIERLLPLVALRLTSLPIQYVIREWDFCSLTLHLVPPVLIPRPETEELVELILSRVRMSSSEACFLEVGPGSGAICCSILQECYQMTCEAVDISRDACDLTKQNAEKAGVLNRLQINNLPIHEYNHDCTSGKFDFLVSNPPYIPSQDMQKLQREISWYEDPVALDGGGDGLDVIRDILNVAPLVVRPGGSVWLEVDSSHPPLIRDLVASSYSHLTYCATHNDFNDIPRFCELRVEDIKFRTPST